MVALAVGHVGITVADLDQTAAWYEAVFGFERIGPPVEIRARDGHSGVVARDVFGPRFGSLRQAHLATANGVGIELFEFLEPGTEARGPCFDYWRTGISHLCLTSPEPAALARRVAQAGGRRRTSRTWPIFPGEPYLTCFCEDPSGNVIELYSHSHERTYSNRTTAG